MLSSKENNTNKLESARRASPVKYIIKFLLVWFLALPIIAAVALLTDINWTKPYVEQKLGESLHREAKVGRLSWHLGMNGISIDTADVELYEITGEPFFEAEDVSIGVAVLPFLSGKLVLKHLDFDKCLVWLVKTGPNRWNFEDLLIEGPEIKLVNINHGKVKVVDSTDDPERKTPFVLDNLKLTFNWPRKDKKLPFFMSVKKEYEDFSTNITLEGFGEGELSTWPTNQYTFKVKGSNIKPDDVNSLLAYFESQDPEEEKKAQTENNMDMDGLLDLNIEGEGTFDEGLNATITGDFKQLALKNSAIGDINAGKASGSMNMVVSDENLNWDNLSFKLRGMTIESSGSLVKWQEEDSKVKADIKGQVHNIKEIDYLLGNLPKKFGQKDNKLLSQFNPSKISGKASVTINLNGTINDTKILTKIETDKLVFGDVIKDAQSQMPLLYVFGVTPESKISGNFRVEDQSKIELQKGELFSPTAKILANGWMDLKKAVGQLKLEANSISLAKTGVNIKQHRSKLITKPGYLEIGKNYEVALSGQANARSTVDVRGNSVNINGFLNLVNAGMSLPKDILNLSKVNGKVEFKFNNNLGKINIPLVTGKMGDGKFELAGSIIARNEPVIDLSLHATHFDLKHLSGLMKLFQVDMPILTESLLYGSVKDVRLRLAGTPKYPEIFFSAVPDDLYYKPPGLEKPLRATAGFIVYDDDQLVLREVALVSRGNTIITSVSIDNVSTEARLTRAKAKTEGIDLADIHYYLSSPVMPPPLQKAYLDLLAEYKLSNPNGKAYGDILCLVGDNGEVVFDGLIGCFKVGVNFYNFPVTNLAGILAASGEDLLIRDMHGVIRESRFSLDGFIKKYRTKDPNWKGQLSAKLHPREIVQVLPNIEDKLQAGEIHVKSNGPLTLRAKILGNFKKNDIQFTLAADKDDRLTIHSRLGTTYQPEGKHLTLDGNVILEPTNLKLKDTHLLMGDTLVAMKGDVKLLPDKDNHGIFPYKPDAVDIDLDFPQEASMNTLVSLINPPLARGLTGELKGNMRAKGKLPNPQLSGKVEFSNIKLPEFGVEKLEGHIRGEPETINGKQATACKLVVYDTEINHILLRNLSADLFYTPGPSFDKPGKVHLKNGHATVASGTVQINGWTDLHEKKHYLKTKMSDVSARKLSQRLLGNPSEVTGDLDSELEIHSQGLAKEDLIKNLQGKGRVRIRNGVVGRFGTLQTRLTQYNLLTQGVFGFNLNNLLQSVWPVRTGEFDELTNDFSIKSGEFTINDLRYTGDDMRLWGAGVASLPKNELKVDIAGKIPRVAKSMLGGTVGSVSRKMTLQRAMHFLTFGKLENLPSLPLIGSIASEKPRTFTFKVTSPLDNPDKVTRSIMKTFKWLPNKPAATAHPVPAIK